MKIDLKNLATNRDEDFLQTVEYLRRYSKSLKIYLEFNNSTFVIVKIAIVRS